MTRNRLVLRSLVPRACSLALMLVAAVGCGGSSGRSETSGLTDNPCPDDPYESHDGFADNDSAAHATPIQSVSDGQDAQREDYYSASLSPLATDVDWFRVYAADDTAANLDPYFSVLSLVPVQYDMCGYVEDTWTDSVVSALGVESCAWSSPSEIEMATDDGGQPRKFHGCCAEGLNSTGGHYAMGLRLDNWGVDDSATIYVRISVKRPTEPNGDPESGSSCVRYSLGVSNLGSAGAGD